MTDARTIREAQELVDAGDATWVGTPHWECPCGTDPPKSENGTTPVRTLLSLRVYRCPFCRRTYREEYRRP